MKNLMIIFLVFLLLVPTVFSQESGKNFNGDEWVVSVLKEIQKIRPGMTRGELLKVFTTEGGLSTGLRRTYVYRRCPYIKLDVDFTAVGRPERDKDGRVTLGEDDRDLIKTISHPYLEWEVAD